MVSATPSDAQQEATRFHDDLVITIVDKLCIAALLLIAKFLLDKSLERYKNREAFLSSFAQQQVQQVADIWKSIYEWEAFVTETGDTVASLDDQFISDREALLAKSREYSTAVRAKVDESRFWLGEDLYGRLQSYHNHLEPYLDAMISHNGRGAFQLRSALAKERQNILTMLGVSARRLYPI